MANLGGESRTEPVPPETQRLVANTDTAIQQQFLNLAKR